MQAAKAAEPDGNTLLVSPIAPMVVYPSVYPSLDYDPVQDFAPVAQLASFEFGIAIGPHVPAKSLAELVAWLKANPSQANFGTPGAGTLPHFFGMMFARSAGIQLQHVPYKGGTLALTDMMGGHIPIVIVSTTSSSNCTGRTGFAFSPRPTPSAPNSCPMCRLSRKAAWTSRAPAGSACSHRQRRHPRRSQGSTPLSPTCWPIRNSRRKFAASAFSRRAPA